MSLMRRSFVHVFNGDSYFNCVGILKGIASLEECGGFSIGRKLIFVSGRDIIRHYSDFDCEKFRMSFCVAGGGRCHDLLAKSFKILQCWPSHVVFHGHQKLAAVFSRIPFMAVSWYCWGLGSTPAKSTYKNLRRCKHIFCTMDPDANALKGVGLSQAQTLVYCPYGMLFWPKDFVVSPIPQSNLRILLGNSCWSIDGYFKLLDELNRYTALIGGVTCVVSYGKPEVHQEKIALLNQYGMKLFGNRFSLLKDLMPLNQYYEFISKYDAYMSLNEQQGGLAVISAMLGMGKIVYLSGVNYEWMRSRGYEVLNCEELRKEGHILGRGFPVEAQQRNCNQYRQRVDPSETMQLWRGLFAE